MTNLLRKTSAGWLSVAPAPFESEMKLEDYLTANPQILQEIFIIRRQVRTGSQQGIPDMIGVSMDGEVCLIELKNEVVTEAVLPQVLQYAIWAETGPDSIKALWLECKDKPDELAIDFDALTIRILIVGPDFNPNVVRMATKIGYKVELIQLQRFAADGEQFVLLRDVEPIEKARGQVTRGQGEYDQAFYEKEHGAAAVRDFMTAASALEETAQKCGWPLEKKFNKYYVGFKLGNLVCFGLGWNSTNTWNLIVKGPEQQFVGVKTKHWELQRYDRGFGQARLRCLQPPSPNFAEVEGLLAAAHQHIAGKTR